MVQEFCLFFFKARQIKNSYVLYLWIQHLFSCSCKGSIHSWRRNIWSHSSQYDLLCHCADVSFRSLRPHRSERNDSHDEWWQQLPSIYISLGILIVHASHLQKGRTWNSQWSTICKGSSPLLHKACQQSPNSNKTLGRIWGSIKALDSRSKDIHTQAIKMLSPWPTTRITVCVFSF